MTIVAVALVLATVALSAAVTSSLSGTQAPRVGCEPPDGVSVGVLCPVSGGTALVQVAISVAQPACVVLACDRFPDQVLRCDGECFPLDLMRRRPLSSAVRA
ncbi:MAG TPA: hypothetical protein VFD76_09650 [Gemmatimonadales bacterium]|jgi:hypothetical protein|nr:hypothetical protein [Gemmatimonadales bacterium]